jgi:putative redox protein
MAEAPATRPGPILDLIWEHDLVFAGEAGQARMTLDSAGVAGPSPVQALAFALTACMAMDIVHILKKGRHELRGFRADLSGERASENPRRFTAIALRFTINGDIAQDVVDRAVELSRDKYCSVWHSLRQDITLSVTSVVATGR